MKGNKHTQEQIIAKLCEAEADLNGAEVVARQAVQEVGRRTGVLAGEGELSQIVAQHQAVELKDLVPVEHIGGEGGAGGAVVRFGVE